jgi:hypothetical protein
MERLWLSSDLYYLYPGDKCIGEESTMEVYHHSGADYETASPSGR